MSLLDLLLVVGGGGLVMGFVTALCASIAYTTMHQLFDAVLAPKKGAQQKPTAAGSRTIALAVALAGCLASLAAVVVICAHNLPLSSAAALTATAAVVAVWASSFVGAYFDRLAFASRQERKSMLPQSDSEEQAATRQSRLRSALMTSVLTCNTIAIALVFGREAAGVLSSDALNAHDNCASWLVISIAVAASVIGGFINQPGVLVQRTQFDGQPKFGGPFNHGSNRSVPAQRRLRPR